MSEPQATPDRISMECTLDEAPEKVWRALSIAEFRERWLTPKANGERFVAEVIEAEPPRRLTLSWRDGADDAAEVLTFTLSPTASGGTWLRLVHDRVAPMPLPVPANTNTMMLLAA
jgi:uncharacterized protein YndB with AHSA1/START domain